jgi:hypothetical protein
VARPARERRRGLEVDLLAGQALEADAPAERADLYGKLLATCSECHTTRPPR